MKSGPDQDHYEANIENIENISLASDKNIDKKETPIDFSLFDDYKKSKELWKEFFIALNGDKDAIDKKIRSFEDDKSGVIGSMRSFEYLLNASDEEVEKEYMKYFEPQTSKFYFWRILSALESDAFKKWFYCEKNKTPDEIDEETKKAFQIVDKIIQVKNTVEKQKALENLHQKLHT